MTTLDHLIATHGYWVLALGCLLEGETMLLLAGFAVHRGLLEPWPVLAVAASAGFAGDQIFFWLGRRHGPAVLARWPAAAAQVERVERLLLRWHAWVIVFVRFAYGLRAAGPVIIGMTPLPAWRFAAFNALGAVLWAGLVGAAGWWFGRAAQALIGDIHHAEGWLLLVLAAALAAGWLWRRLRRAG
ncbi:MAG: DedA family protein [Burkholderiales bacterium]|nr:DedA family protein [Burkholderiales bacterium]